MNMEFFQVHRYGKTTKAVKKVNPLQQQISIAPDTDVYFVNTKFSDPNCGFVMTAEGIVITTTTNCELTGEAILKYVEPAKAKIATGELGDLNLKFNF